MGKSIEELREELASLESKTSEENERKMLIKKIKAKKFQTTRLGKVATGMYNVAEKITRPKTPEQKAKILKQKLQRERIERRTRKRTPTKAQKPFDFNDILKGLPQ